MKVSLTKRTAFSTVANADELTFDCLCARSLNGTAKILINVLPLSLFGGVMHLPQMLITCCKMLSSVDLSLASPSRTELKFVEI